jgi:hypothetical protein
MLDSVGNDKKMTTSKEAMMDDVKIVFKNDGSYTITMFERIERENGRQAWKKNR